MRDNPLSAGGPSSQTEFRFDYQLASPWLPRTKSRASYSSVLRLCQHHLPLSLRSEKAQVFSLAGRAICFRFASKTEIDPLLSISTEFTDARGAKITH